MDKGSNQTYSLRSTSFYYIWSKLWIIFAKAVHVLDFLQKDSLSVKKSVDMVARIGRGLGISYSKQIMLQLGIPEAFRTKLGRVPIEVK